MINIFDTRTSDPKEGSFTWRERYFSLKDISFMRVCEKSGKIEVYYRDKPMEKIMCTPEEITDIVKEINV